MNLDKLIELEEKLGFEDVNAIRNSGIHSFLDEWVVTGLLGRGSFGNVYQIMKPQDGLIAQKCALKICQVVNDDDVQIRTQEIETQKLLDGHPNAVQIEDFALIFREPPRVSYLIIRMELLRPLPEKGLSEREVIRMGIDICRVLEKCSSMEPKLIHCDIKPANILMTDDGRYKLADFGTAKTLQATMTYTGNRGTPLYMAPEVASYTGYDSRCDILSLGYSMLTMLNGGKHPYHDAGERVDILREMYSSRKLPNIKKASAGLLKIIRRMCEPSLSVRYSRASAVRRDLELYIRREEEAERNALLEAERQAEIAHRKGKLERARNLRAAEDTLKKAQLDLDTARNEPECSESRISELESGAELAALVLRYVVEGDTLEAARRKAKGRLEQNEFFRKQSLPRWIGFAAVLFGAAVLVFSLFVSGLFDSLLIEDEQKPAKEEHRITEQVKDDSSSVQYRDFIFESTADGEGYILKDYVGRELTRLTVPEVYNWKPVVEISDKAFFDADNLISVVIPEGVQKIGESAFEGCDRLEEVELKKVDVLIGDSAFANCRSLDGFLLTEDLSVPVSEESELLTYRDFVFALSKDKRGYVLVDYVGSGKANLQIPRKFNWKPVVGIGDKAFYNAENILGVTVPDSVEAIGKSAFEGCTELEFAELGEGVRSIGEMAFRGCRWLTDISIPDCVNVIGKAAFKDCNISVSAPENPDYYGYEPDANVVWLNS